MLDHDALHLSRFLFADVLVGMGHPAQQVSEGGNLAGAVRLQLVQCMNDLADGLSFRRSARCLLDRFALRFVAPSQEIPDRHLVSLVLVDAPARKRDAFREWRIYM